MIVQVFSNGQDYKLILSTILKYIFNIDMYTKSTMIYKLWIWLIWFFKALVFFLQCYELNHKWLWNNVISSLWFRDTPCVGLSEVRNIFKRWEWAYRHCLHLLPHAGFYHRERIWTIHMSLGLFHTCVVCEIVWCVRLCWKLWQSTLQHITLFVIIHSSRHIFGEFNQLDFCWEFGSEAMLVVVQHVVLCKMLHTWLATMCSIHLHRRHVRETGSPW